MIYDSFYVPNYKLGSCLRLPQSQQPCKQATTEKCGNRCQIVRENVPLIVVVVGDRKRKISSNKVDGHVRNCLRPVCDYK